MITVIDYKMGNLRSVTNALKALGADFTVSSSAEDIKRADKLILPGVGAFPDACRALTEMGIFDLIKSEAESGKPMLGICLGMQLLFCESYEFEKCAGLALIEGSVVPIPQSGLKIPHMGWNSLNIKNASDALLQNVNSGDYVYFVHSFMAKTDSENILASTHYGAEIPALVKSPKLNIWGAQFHPEKSHDTGLKILKSFCNY